MDAYTCSALNRDALETQQNTRGAPGSVRSVPPSLGRALEGGGQPRHLGGLWCPTMRLLLPPPEFTPHRWAGWEGGGLSLRHPYNKISIGAFMLLSWYPNPQARRFKRYASH